MKRAVLPWHQNQWHNVVAAIAGQRLVHALLLGGPAGTGRRHFCDVLSAMLLCRAPAPADGPCGACASCRQFQAGTHADMFRLEPDEAGKAIGVDSVRDLTDRLQLTAGRGTKVGVIDPADALTTSAANSLLKTLEEPPAGTYLMLLTARTGRIPATVRSRCQRIAFAAPPADQALEWLRGEGVEAPGPWLARAGGGPVLARDLARADAGDSGTDPVGALLAVLTGRRSPVGAATVVARVPLDDIVRAWIIVVEDLLRLMHAPRGAVRLPDRHEELAAATRQVDERRLFDYLDTLYRSLPGPSSALRAPMQIEGLLADAAGVVDREPLARG